MIRHLGPAHIDKKKWDACIAASPDRMIYAYSWYLDIVSPGWEALAEDDYSSVMPLTCRKKYGIRYLYQPPFTQQLGVFARGKAGIRDFASAIPAEFRLVEINMHTGIRERPQGFECAEWLTHHLPLTASYTGIEKNYSSNHRRNIRKAMQAGMKAVKGADPSSVIRLFRKGRGARLSGMKPADYRVLSELISACLQKNKALVMGVTDSRDRLMAGAFFLVSDGKAIFIFSGTHDDARNTGALHLLIDSFIREYAGSDLVLDFEGSNDKDLARFYKGFGASELVYLHVRKNELPAMIRWLKK